MRLWVFAYLAAALIPACAQNTTLTDSWYLSGRVMMEDGAAPPEPVPVQSVCNGVSYTVAMTDSHGLFSFRAGGGSANGLVQDASIGRLDPVLGRLQAPLGIAGSASQTVGGTSQSSTQTGAADSASTSSSNAGGRPAPTERTLDYCELRASLPGFVPAAVSLLNRKPVDDQSLDTLVLYRIHTVEGRTVSVTTLAAPKAARTAYDKGRKARDRKKPDQARAEFEKAVSLYPQFAAAWNDLGQLQTQQNQFGEAALSFENAIQADSKYVPPYLGLAIVRLSQRQWVKLVAITQQALALDPFSYPQAYYLNALASLNTHDLETAEKSAREAERLDKQHRLPQAWRVLGQILASRREYEASAAQFREYLRFAPQATDAAEVQRDLARVEQLSAIH